MNNSLIKMLKFEFRTNYRLWAMKLFGIVTLMLYLNYSSFYISGASHIFDARFSIFAIATWWFTFNSYQESVKNQSMQMYHLLPVSQNIKFFSKQLITFLAFPFLLLSVYYILASVINSFVDQTQVFFNVPSSERLFTASIFWILGHSILTFFAIVFKKNKALYSVITLIVIITLLATINRIVTKLFDTDYFIAVTGSPLTIVPEGISYVLPVVLYIASYHLFFRRQL
jgi:hypothetical protein